MRTAHKTNKFFRFPYAFDLCAALALSAIVLSATMRPAQLPYATEAQFTDTSANGLAIVPASCPSAPPTSTENPEGYYGYQLPPGSSGAYVYGSGLEYCLTNPTRNIFFVPVHTQAEFNAFIAAAPGLGVTVTTPQSYHGTPK